MRMKLTPIAAVTLGLACADAGPTSADALNDIATGVEILRDVCGIMGCNQPRQAAPQQQPTVIYRERRAAQPQVSQAELARRAAERQANIDVQSALNGFGFNVGAADGDLGPRSRAAIGQYQTYMGYPASGYLDENQRAILLNSYARLQTGEGSRYPQVTAAEGTRGLLRAFNDPNYIARYGVSPTAPGYPNVATNTQPDYGVAGTATGGIPQAPYPALGAVPGAVPDMSAGLTTGSALYPATLPTTAAPAGQAIDTAAEAPLGPLEELEPIGQVASSMADRCQFVELTTQTNQGPIRVSNMTDPAQALSEQFCEARGYAISVGQNTTTKVKASEAQLAASCQQINLAMGPVRAALASTPPEAIVTRAAAVNQRIAPNATAAATYGQICLGLGYRQDDAEMALSANLLLLGAGYMPFGEMLGHHLREGFGVTPSNASALPWYEAALTALQGSAQPVFLPSKSTERAEIIRAAIDSGQIRASAPAMPGTLVPISAPLPGGQAISQ